jgi:hypothetical protein
MSHHLEYVPLHAVMLFVGWRRPVEHGKAAMTEHLRIGSTHDHAEPRFVFLDVEWQRRLRSSGLQAISTWRSTHAAHFSLSLLI